ncbi:MAG TPA: cytochrome C [Acidobacteriota bacterium]|nr:cytochrome C [Acidobacteriota bacterium]
MRKLLKVLGVILVGIVLAVVIALSYVFLSLPKSEPAPNITVQATPARLEQGKYLATHVTGCVYCHSVRNAKLYAEPVVSGTEGQGSIFIQDPGRGILVAPNITPAALKDWSDGEILRAMISGVNRKGKPLFPIMPYQEFAVMSREDLYSVIAYIRSLDPKPSTIPETHLKFPLNLIVRTIPQPTAIREQATANRGEYLTTIAGCRNCHTPQGERGVKMAGMDFAGGMEFQTGDGSVVRSANITPDDGTGIGKWSREQFLSVFKRYESPALQQIPVERGNTVMPWVFFSGMKEEDLAAIYDYLRTVKPIDHRILNKTLQLP